MLYCALEHGTGSSEAVASIEKAINLRSIPRPLLDLGEVARSEAAHNVDARRKQNQ
jgi:hypothetical protein